MPALAVTSGQVITTRYVMTVLHYVCSADTRAMIESSISDMTSQKVPRGRGKPRRDLMTSNRAAQRCRGAW